MPETNPYESPTPNLTTESRLEYAEIKLLSAAGRLGRLRYIVYSFGVVIGVYILAVLAGIASYLLPEGANTFVMGILGIIAVIAIVYLSIVLMVQRLHDTNKSGWFSLIMLVPFISLLFTLYLWFMPGSDEENDYGNPPPPNKTAVLIIAILVIVIVIGILAAIAIPAYNDYLLRAQQGAG